jgi:uncharacterized protein (TIGR02996 family)
VTDDEAFIRAIVANPADDAPRLVYADWLDERNDPRGAYLRAEVTWAEPWHTGGRPTRDTGLLDLAGDLDPVWTARVSRPPIGMCHSRLRFVSPGPRLNRDDIRTFERQTSISVPDAFAALLLNSNGGVPSRRRVRGTSRRGLGTFRMLAPAGWSPAADSSHLPPHLLVLSDADPTAGQAIEFADDRAAGGYFIGISAGAMGVVYYTKDRGSRFRLGYDSNFLGIAPSLPELLAAVG